jgi:hypothetical protein
MAVFGIGVEPAWNPIGITFEFSPFWSYKVLSDDGSLPLRTTWFDSREPAIVLFSAHDQHEGRILDHSHHPAGPPCDGIHFILVDAAVDADLTEPFG